MSVTAQARPYGLLTDLIDVIKDVAVEDKIANKNFSAMNYNIKNLMEGAIDNENAEEVVKKAVEMISKEYETVFADRNLLVKTLEEHGVENIQISGNSITGRFGDFRIDCFRENQGVFETKESLPFRMKITAECSEEEISELVNEINSEYALNTQEENYVKIKERLEKQGLQISEEEILENDTIVLTVNIG